MNRFPIVSLLMLLCVILIIRIIYKAWRSRQGDSNVRRRPDKPVAQKRPVATETVAAKSPLEPPPVPVVPPPPPVPVPPAAASERIRRDTVSSIHDDDSVPTRPEGSRSRIFGNKPAAGSGIWGTNYVTASGMAKSEPEAAAPQPLEEEIIDGSDLVFGPATTTLAAMLPESDDRRRDLTRSLQNAGYYSRNAWHNLSAIRYLGIILPIIVCGLMLVFGPPRLEPLFVAGIVILPMVGWALPTLIVRGRAEERLREISNGMPDMLDLLNMCVSQGMTVPKALGRVGRELEPVYPALSKELKIVTEQSRVGSLQQSLAGLSQRVDLPEVHSFTSLIIQTERMGTSMSDALVDYSDSMRETMRQRADQKANSATFKLLFPTVLCLMPAVYLFLLGPAVIQLADFYSGRGREVLQAGATAATGNALNQQQQAE